MTRYTAIAAAPLREVLLAYVALLKREAQAAYERQIDRYYHGRSMREKPTPPDILNSATA